MDVKPLADRVLVRATEADTVRDSGLIIPDTATEKSQLGVVLAAGQGTTTDTGTVVPLEVGPGDGVLYSKYGGTEVMLDGESLIVLRGSDVLAKVE